MRGMVESFDGGMEPQKAGGGSQGWRLVAMPTGNWTAPRDGLYRIHSWGAGAGSNAAVYGTGFGGAYQQKITKLAKNDSLTIVIGACIASGLSTSAATVAGPGFTMNSGTCSGGSGPTPTGGDINIASVGSNAASSPDGIYKGGLSGGDQAGGYSPGGGTVSFGGSTSSRGAGGMVIIEEYV